MFVNLTLMGMGPGAAAYVPELYRERLREAELIFVPERLRSLLRELTFPQALAETVLQPSDGRVTELLAKLEELCRSAKVHKLVVCCTGDTQVFSLASYIRSRLPESESLQIDCLPGLSAAQILAARLNLKLSDTKLCSVHGAKLDSFWQIWQGLAEGEGLICFTDPKQNPTVLAELLCRYHYGESLMIVGERLSYEDEHLSRGTAAEMLSEKKAWDPLNLCYLEKQSTTVRSRVGALPDEVFQRGPRPMSKRAVRSLALSLLELPMQGVFWDIGAGTGAVACDVARSVPGLKVYAIERGLDSLWLIQTNAEKLGLANVTVVGGEAPEACENLEDPDVVFIGGSGKRLAEILLEIKRRAGRRGRAIRVLMTTVSLESAAEIERLLGELGTQREEAVQIQAAVTRALGAYHLWQGENPVSFWPFILAPGEAGVQSERVESVCRQGHFYALGVGPGSPTDLTMGVWQRLQACPVIAYPQTAPGRPVLALEAVRPYLGQQTLLSIDYPMQRGAHEHEEILNRAVQRIRKELDAGRDVAFLTLGDPCIYSTAFWLGDLLKTSGYNVHYQSGVSSLTAGFARLGISMGEFESRCAIIPADGKVEAVQEAWQSFRVILVMKAAQVLAELYTLAATEQVLDSCYVLQNMGLPSERLYALRDYPEMRQQKEPYLTTVIMRRPE